MSRELRFRFEPYKFVNAAAYLASKCPDTTKMKLSKLLFFADKHHLLNYGRPIIGDRYVKMEFGPVPSMAYNLMKHDDRASVDDQVLFDENLDVNGNHIVPKKEPDLRYLSESDIEALDCAIAKYGHLTPAQLSKLSHREPAWKSAEMNWDMDYRLLFTAEEAQHIYALVQEDQELRDALTDVEFEDFVGILQS